MKIETKFDINDMVILKHDKDKIERMICGITIRGEEKRLEYNLCNGSNSSWHYEHEMERKNGEEKKVAGFKH